MVAVLQWTLPACILQWWTVTDLDPDFKQAGQALLQCLIHFSWETLKSIMQAEHIPHPLM